MEKNNIKYYHLNDESLYPCIFDNINLKNNKKLLIYLNGEVGSGKTSLVRSFINYIGDEQDVTSPTFTIINEYYINSIKIYHYDFYRIKSIKELLAIGIDHYLEQEAFHFLEWPKKFISHLPKPNIEFDFTILGSSRLLKSVFKLYE